MAQKTTIELVDDLDGGKADVTVTFALDGVSYEIDLRDANAAALRKVFEFWLPHARKVSKRGGARGSNGASNGRVKRDVDLNEVRTWARTQGYEVASRGRVKSELVAEYIAAH